MKHYLKKAIRLSNHLSPGDTVCRSAQLSWRHPFYVIALLSLLPPGHPTCANEWQSAAVALIYCMAARTEPVCQRCIAALWHTNTCDAEPVCQERVPARCSVHSGWGGRGLLDRTSSPSCTAILSQWRYWCGGKRQALLGGAAVFSVSSITRRERPLRFILYSFVFC